MIETTRVQEPDDLPRTEALTNRGSIPPKEPDERESDPLQTQAMPEPLSTQEQPQATQVVANMEIMATAAGAPTVMTMSRAGGKPIVAGYELLESVGKGGMGIVYRARQIALDRDIALKFLREDFHPGSGTGLRFLEEAKITAQLQHPGIPAVHEVGALPDGRPYLAMKLIRGRTLDTMLKEQGPGSTKWLSVFEAICHAVGFAHTHGVIHRDLKPANIMVGAFGEVQVMDWGLAKVLGRASIAVPESEEHEAPAFEDQISSRSEGSVETRAGSYLGTPAFMAPEQASGELELHGPRTDVFGLGGILCMLLTGKPPYMGGNSETTRLMAAAVQQTDVNERLDASGADPDLIDLCKRCMAGDPAKRPADGAVVARQVASLRSYAEERAKQAEVDIAKAEVAAVAERKRQRQKRIAAGVVAFVFAVGAVAATIGFVNADRAKGVAQVNEKRAIDNANEAEANRLIAVANENLAKINEARAIENKKKADEEKAISESTLNFFLKKLLNMADAEIQSAALTTGAKIVVKENPTILELLDRAAVQLTPENIEKHYAGQPKTQASVLQAIGDTYRGIGEFPQAIAHLKRALGLYLKVSQGRDDTTSLEMLNSLAMAYRATFQHKEAIPMFEKIRDIYAEKHKAEPDHNHVLISKKNLADAYRMAGRPKDALKLYEECQKAYHAKKDWGPNHPDTLKLEESLGVTLKDVGRIDAAITLLTAVLKARTKILTEEHTDTVGTMSNLAESHRHKGEKANLEIAIDLSKKVVTASTNKRGAIHPYTLAAMSNLARTYLESVNLDTGAGREVPANDFRLVEAVRLYELVCAGAAKKYIDTHATRISYEAMLAEAYLKTGEVKKAIAQFEMVRERYLATYGLANTDTKNLLNNLATAYLRIGAPDKASVLLEQLYDLDRKDPARGEFHPDTILGAHNLGMVLLEARDESKALPFFEEAARGLKKLQYRHDAALSILETLAGIYEKNKRYADAEPHRRNFVTSAKQDQGADSPRHLTGLALLGMNLMEQKKWSEAVVPLQESVTRREKPQAGKWQLYFAQSLLGAALSGDGKTAEAEPLLLESFEGLVRTADTIAPAFKHLPKTTGERLLALYEATKQTDKAKDLKAKLAAMK